MWFFNAILYIFIASLPLDYSQFKLFGLLTPTEIVAISIIYASLILFIANKATRTWLIQFTPFIVAYFAFSLFLTFSVFLNTTQATMRYISHIWSSFFVFLSLIVLIKPRSMLSNIKSIFFVVGLTIACLNIAQTFITLPIEVGRVVYSRIPFVSVRVSSINPIFAVSGTFLFIALMVTVEKLIQPTRFLKRMPYIFALLTLGIGLLINQSRSIFIATLAALLAYFAIKLSRNPLRNILVALSLGITILLHINYGYINLESIVNGLISLEERTVISRVNQYYYVRDIIASGSIANIITGFGPEIYYLASPDSRDLHNTFIYTFLSYGIAGISTLALMLILLTVRLVKRLNTDTTLFFSIIIGLIISMNGYNAFSSYIFPVVYAISLTITKLSYTTISRLPEIKAISPTQDQGDSIWTRAIIKTTELLS